MSQKAPDHSVFSRFRDQLIKHDLYDRLFKELNHQLEEKGLIVKKGTLIDATVIEAAAKKPKQNEGGTGGSSEQDPDAGWTKKGGKYLFGYKAHVGVDQQSELIRKVQMTPASVYDGKVFAPLVNGDEEWVFADKAYDSKENGETLQKRNIENGIMIKGVRNRPLGVIEKRCNRVLSRLRSHVERVFGTMKRSYRYWRSKYLGLRKNMLQITMTCMVYNLKSLGKLCA